MHAFLGYATYKHFLLAEISVSIKNYRTSLSQVSFKAYLILGHLKNIWGDFFSEKYASYWIKQEDIFCLKKDKGRGEKRDH